jgi:hypothetical protein
VKKKRAAPKPKEKAQRKRRKPYLFEHQINRKDLLSKIGVVGEKLAPGFQGVFENIDIINTAGKSICRTTVKVDPTPTADVTKGRKSSQHRIHVGCPVCGKFIPFGRYGQHIGSEACEKNKKGTGVTLLP